MNKHLNDNDLSKENGAAEGETTEASETKAEPNAGNSDGEKSQSVGTQELQEDVITVDDLPPGFTEEPQDPEHMDLRKVPEYRKWFKAYRNVSDDEGHLLDDLDLEKDVKEMCKDLSSMDLTLEESHNLWIDRITDLVLRYDSTINERENTTAGVFAKYRIRLGMLLNFQKELVKHRLKQNWTKWFPENYETISLRSAQEYMRIAEYKGAIKFAVFGIQRLLQMVRQIGKPDGTDQIEKFLEENGIDFNPEVETDFEKLRTATDIAITRQKLNNEGLEDVTDDIVEDLVQDGIYLTKGHLRNIKLLKDRGDDLPEYIGRLIDAGGKVESIKTPESKAKLFKKTVDRFLDQADTALNDDQYLGELDVEIIQRITEKIRQIEQKLASLAS